MDWSQFHPAMIDSRYLHGSESVFKVEPHIPVRIIVENPGKFSPEEIAEDYDIDLRLVLGTERLIESQSVVLSPV